MAEVVGNFVKVTFKGTAYSGGTWSTSFWLQSTVAAAPGGMQALADGAGDTVFTANLLTAMRSLINSTSTIASIQYDAYQPDTGTLFDRGSHSYASPGTGTGQGSPDLAMVATMLTAGYGRAYRGRMYFPAWGMPGTSGQIPSATLTSFATALKTYLSAWNASDSETVVLISRSRGAATPINGIRIDSKYDTQRRREDKIAALTTSQQAVTP